MRTPNAHRAEVPEEKVVSYLLSTDHPVGRHKAAFFARFGFRAERWEELAAALRNHVSDHDPVEVTATPFGTKYAVPGPLRSPDGRNPLVRSVWIVEHGENVPRLVTAHPD